MRRGTESPGPAAVQKAPSFRAGPSGWTLGRRRDKGPVPEAPRDPEVAARVGQVRPLSQREPTSEIKRRAPERDIKEHARQFLMGSPIALQGGEAQSPTGKESTVQPHNLFWQSRGGGGQQLGPAQSFRLAALLIGKGRVAPRALELHRVDQEGQRPGSAEANHD